MSIIPLTSGSSGGERLRLENNAKMTPFFGSPSQFSFLILICRYITVALMDTQDSLVGEV